jgi:hypothetical protein
MGAGDRNSDWNWTFKGLKVSEELALYPKGSREFQKGSKQESNMTRVNMKSSGGVVGTRERVAVSRH